MFVTFTFNLKHHGHYFDTVRGDISGLEAHADSQQANDRHGYTALEENIFLTKCCYVGDDGDPIIFDSGCICVMTPYNGVFLGESNQLRESRVT